MVWRSARQPLDDRIVSAPIRARGRVAVTAAALLGFCLLLPWLGYLLVSFAFVAVLLRRLGGGGWTGAIAIAVATAAASYYLFAVLLGVPLPQGVVLP